jgi:hypothetical protein
VVQVLLRSFLCFVLPNSFLTVPETICLVFMSYAPRLIFDGPKGIASGSYILRSITCFRRSRGWCVHFSSFTLWNIFFIFMGFFRLFSHFVLSDYFEYIGISAYVFHVLLSYTHFQLSHGWCVQFLSFVISNSFSTVP